MRSSMESWTPKSAPTSMRVRTPLRRTWSGCAASLAASMCHATSSRGDDWNAAITADNDFHVTLVKLVRDGRMTAMYEQMGSQTILLLISAAETDVSLRGAPLQAIHRAIIDAVASRDADRAGHAVADHYRYTRGRLF